MAHQPWKPLVRLAPDLPPRWVRVNDRQEVNTIGVCDVMLWINNAGDARIVLIVVVARDDSEHVSQRYATEAEAVERIADLMSEIWERGWALYDERQFTNGKLYSYTYLGGRGYTEPERYNNALFPPEPHIHHSIIAASEFCHMHERLGR